VTHRFHVSILAEPQALCRVLGVIAQRSLVPDRLDVSRAGDQLEIALEIAGITADVARLVAARLEAQVLVVRVALSSLARMEATEAPPPHSARERDLIDPAPPQ
jgi:acetolactate synthase regulatory subunit